MKAFATIVATAWLLAPSRSALIPHPPIVDLGYSVYQGSYDADNRINVFKGIRYAAPPLGILRFAAPIAPEPNRTTTVATVDAPICPQTGTSSQTPPAYGFTSKPGNEDCLFLNVFAPAEANNLPVFFWIHGGGYNLFSAQGLDPTDFMVTNQNNFISVIIQYRLGAFGFLSSEEVQKDGALNAGLLDINFALEWVQQNIEKFGGDKTKVTLAGESAGGGAVLYLALAHHDGKRDSLFNNVITASPWIPYQYNYNDIRPLQAYDSFATLTGCAHLDDTLTCLREADTAVLQNASATVSEAGPFGTFAFVPVTDGSFVQDRATTGLFNKALHGRRVLSGNMANEGVPLSPPDTRTLEDFRKYIDVTFPGFSAEDKANIEQQYSFAGDDQNVDPKAAKFATNGLGSPSAVNVSSFGSGQQQRVFDVFAEYAFVCPSYWAAGAFPQGWKYQFSAPPAYHGYDLQALWSGHPTPGASFKHAFRKIWGNFITTDSPVISVEDAKGGVALSTVPAATGHGSNGNIQWPQWNDKQPSLLNLNMTGGQSKTVSITDLLQITTYSDPGVFNQISVADATSWEGGRGKRCDFWKNMAAKVPY